MILDSIERGLRALWGAGRATLRQFPTLYLAWSQIRPKPKRYGKVRGIYRSFVRRNGSAVLNGPFKGMAYFSTNASVFSFVLGTAAIPKLLGCYEEELHSVINLVLRGDYDRVLNVGCAEGYYAVGFARAIPQASVLAFDIDPLALALCERLAVMNGVQDRLHLRGGLGLIDLDHEISSRCFIMMDCEGCELDLITGLPAERFSECGLLVETHEFVLPGSSSRLANHFRSTHTINKIDVQERDPSKYPELEFLPSTMQQLAMNEFRPQDETWLHMTPLKHQ